MASDRAAAKAWAESLGCQSATVEEILSDAAEHRHVALHPVYLHFAGWGEAYVFYAAHERTSVLYLLQTAAAGHVCAVVEDFILTR